MDETILYEGHPPMFRNQPLLFILFLALIAFFGLGIPLLLGWYAIARSHKLTITDRELRYERGILNKQHSEMQLSAVRSVRVNQNLWQRMFGMGDIEIYSAGDNPEIVAKGMPDPARVREIT